jgi:hypothetical protein
MSRTLTYAGIGNRNTPGHILALMQRVATRLEKHNYTLMSGGAKGADSAFASGTKHKRIWTAAEMIEFDRNNNRGYTFHRDKAEEHHPAWWRLTPYVQWLMVRNVYIILGTNYWSSVKFVLCYAEDETRGGTSHSLRIARAYNIPVYNLAKSDPHKTLLQLKEDFDLNESS